MCFRHHDQWDITPCDFCVTNVCSVYFPYTVRLVLCRCRGTSCISNDYYKSINDNGRRGSERRGKVGRQGRRVAGGGGGVGTTRRRGDGGERISRTSPRSHLISSRLCPSTAGCSPPSMSSIFVCLLPS